ncbi:unnamed protein product [Sympodiomycopsis kandeliae]
MTAQASDEGSDRPSASQPHIFTLPQEVLLQALLLLQPHDVSSFSQSCATFHQLVIHSSSLWRGLYLKAWDAIPGTSVLPVLRDRALKEQTEGHAQSAAQSAKSKGKARRIDNPVERTSSAEAASGSRPIDTDFSLESLVQRRAKARQNLRKGASDPHQMLIAHTETLRELVAAARSRLAREHSHENYNADLPQSRTSSSLASMFPQNHVGDTRWATYVYPRESLQRLIDWQPSRTHAAQCTVQRTGDDDDEEKEIHQRSEACDDKDKSHNGNKKQQKSGSSKNARKRAASPSSASGSSRPRRSARLRKSNIPRELHSLLREGTSDMQTLGMSLELWPVHDHLSSELHVLHGVRMMKRDSPMDKLEKAEKRMKQMRARKAASRASNGGTGQGSATRTLSKETGRSKREANAGLSDDQVPVSDDDEEAYESGYEGSGTTRSALDLQPGLSSQSTSLHGRLLDRSNSNGGGEADNDEDDEADDDYEEDPIGDEDVSGQGIAHFEPDQGDLDVIDGITSQDEADYLSNLDIDGIADEALPAFLFGHQLERPYLLLGSEDGPSGDPKLLAKAKSLVYDAGRFAYENCWGPLKSFRDTQDRPNRPDFDFSEDDTEGEDSDDDLHYDDPEVIDLDEGSEGDSDADSAVGAAQFGANATATSHGLTNLAPGVEIIDGNLVVPDGPTVPVHLIQEYMAQQESENSHGNHDHEHASVSGDSDDEEGSLSEMLAEEEDDWSDDSFQADLFGLHEDTFSQRVAWVGAYAGSKARVSVSSIRGQRGSHRRTHSQQSENWSRAREVDWTVVESIMIDVHANLIRAIRSGGWGTGFILPPGGRGQDGGGVGELSDANICEHHRQARQLLPPSGWTHSRGSTTLPACDSNDGSDSTKKRDWANIEGATWAGTYFFCDYPVFLEYNARLAGAPTQKHGMCHQAEVDINLLVEEGEAFGDCLSLRMELLNAEEETEAKAKEDERGDGSEFMGEEDPEFPILRFKGRSYTINPDSDPRPRGNCWGSVRPVYANPEESASRPYLRRVDPTSGRELPEIVALQWRIVHAYEGADRWSLTGIQAGPPGTRAPIYGIWSDITEERGSPVGPFVYMNVDSRPWKEVENLLSESRAERDRRQRQQQAQ